MVDIVLVQPITTIKGSLLAPLPLSLLTVSALPHKEGYSIKIIDQRVEKNWKEKLLDSLRSNPICVGISVMMGNSIINAMEISKIVKENSNTKVIWGGPFPTFQPLDCFQCPYVDIIVSNEGEQTFIELVKCIESKKDLETVKSIWYRIGDTYKFTGTRQLIDLNSIPDLPYELVNIKNYKVTSWNTSEPTINIVTSRGCIHKCTYCYTTSMFGSTWRALTAERVANVISSLYQKYKIHNFLFMDDNFFVGLKRSVNISEMIKKEDLDISMEFQGVTIKSVTEMNEENLRLFESVGCRIFQIGVESGSERIRRLIQKDYFTIEQLMAANRKLAKYRIVPKYNLITGFPTETIQDLSETIHLSVKLKKENPNALMPILTLYAPIIGTKGYGTALQYGYVPPNNLKDWGEVDFGHDGYINRLNENVKSKPWITKQFLEMYKRLIVTHIVTQNEMKDLKKRNKQFKDSLLLRMSFDLYKLIAEFRYRYSYYEFMPEVKILETLEANDII